MPIGINSVTIGTCTAGTITVTADITFPANAVTKSASAIIINSAGQPVSGLFTLSPVGGDIYVGSVSGVPPGNNYKAKAFANWTVPDDDNKTSTNVTSCPMPSPPPPPPPAVPPKDGPKKPPRG